MKKRIVSAVIAGVMTLVGGSFAYAGRQGEEGAARRTAVVKEEAIDGVFMERISEKEAKGEETASGKQAEEDVSSKEQPSAKEDKEEDKKAQEKGDDTRKETPKKKAAEKTSSDNTSSDSRPSGGTGSRPSGNATKPDSKPSNKPSNKPSGGSNQSQNKPSKPAHTHSWKAQTTMVNHPATGHNEQVLVKEAWTETKLIYGTVAIEVCGNCGADCTSDPSGHIKEHMMNGTGQYGTHTEYVQKQTGTETITHPAEYETRWVQDSAAWSETVVTGYSCSCGATK